MAIQEVVLRPGDSISVRLEVPGQPLRLEMSLTPEGMAVSGPVPVGAHTVFGGVPPVEEVEAVDLDAEFAAQDGAPSPQPAPGAVESLAAVEPFDSPLEAVDIPFEDITEDTGGSYDEATVVDDASSGDDLDLDLSDLDGEEEFSVGPDVPGDDGGLYAADEGGGVDIPGDDDLDMGGLDIDIPEDDGVDIPGDDDAGFSADAMTMVPPSRGQSAPAALSIEDDDAGMSLESMSLDEEPHVEVDADGNPKEKFVPNEDDTLPVWTGKARTYQDPEVQKKKTAKLNKAAQPASKPAPAAKPLPGKAKLPSAAKSPITKPIKKPVTGGVGPAAASAKKPAVAGGGNFTVFLSPPKGADKKQAAAEIIAEIQGIDMNSAVALAGKMIVPVVKGVSENEAQGVRDRFKDAGLSCRITQKR